MSSLSLGAHFNFSASGGIAPYNFEIISSTGGTISSGGLFTAPTEAEAVGETVVIRVTDQSGMTAIGNIVLTAPLSVLPSRQNLGGGANLAFVASGGVSPYTYSLLSGDGSIGFVTGFYTAGSNSGSSVIRVTDSIGNYVDAILTIIGLDNSSLALSPQSIVLAPNNVFSFSASGGNAPYTYSLSSGIGIISTDGKYTAPSISGSAVISVSDALGATATASITINSSLVISSLLTQMGMNSSFTFVASGGVLPYTFSVLSGGGTIGLFSGIYTAPDFIGTTTIMVIDSVGNRTTRTFDIVETLKLNVSSLIIERTKNYQFVTRGGAIPYSYSTTVGTIVTSSGYFAAPTVPGSGTVTVTDLTGQVASASLTVPVLGIENLSYMFSPYKIIIGEPVSPPIMPDYTGDSPTFSIDPALPSGLVINPSSGVISGTASSVSANALYTVTATNAQNSLLAQLYLQVYANNSFTIDSPIEGETIAAYQILRGSCIVGQTVTIITSSNLTVSTPSSDCLSGSYATGLISASDFGPRWIRVSQANKSLVRNVFSANSGFSNNWGWERGESGYGGQVIARDSNNGKIYMGGDFRNVQFPNTNKRSTYLLRLNSDGSLDASFMPMYGGFDANVTSLVIDANGKIIVGGNFNSYDGTTSEQIIRLNADATVDSSFNPPSLGNAGTNIYDMAIDSNGKILILGYFSSYSGTSRKYIVRLNSNGSLDASFVPDGTGFNNSVYSIAVEADGKIAVGGLFTSYNGTPVNHIATLSDNGSLDTGFTVSTGSGFNNGVNSIAIDNNGKLVVSGWFTLFDGVIANRIVRLNASGTRDSSFASNITGIGDQISSLAIDINNKVIAGGYFVFNSGANLYSVVRFNTDGSFDTNFTNYDIGLLGINSIVVDSGNQILLGMHTGTPSTFISKLNSDGTVDTSFGPAHNGLNDDVKSLAIDSNGKIIVGGAFTAFGGILAKYIARINSDNTLDTSFSPVGTSLNGIVNAIALASDGKIVVGGEFNDYNGTALTSIARLSTTGTLDTSFALTGTGLDNTVNTLAMDSNGKIIVGGLFSSYDGTPTSGIIRINPDGTHDSSFNFGGSGFVGQVNSLALDPNGKIVCGGVFNSYNGVPRGSIARLNSDGSLDTSFVPSGTAFDDEVDAVAIDSNGKIVVGGLFTSYNSIPANYIARLNSDGTLDSSFSPSGIGFNSSVTTLVVEDNGKIVVGGQFSAYDNVTRVGMVRLNSDGTLDSSFEPDDNVAGFDEPVNVLAIDGIGRILVGGHFMTYYERITPYIAILNSDSSMVNTGPMIIPANKGLVAQGTFAFSAIGGSGAYTYSVLAGGGSIDSSSGIFTAPISAGTSTIEVLDNNLGSKAWASIATYSSVVSINPTLVSRQVNQFVSFSSTGGLSPYYYQIISGGGTIDSTGYFIAPNYPCVSTVRVTDISGNSADASITVAP
jgi:uncharacterized delta-60 repeat protein